MRHSPRLNRLFAADGRCFDVAIDHGFFNEPSFLVGIENLAAAVMTIRAAAPDAIQLTAGQAHHLQDLPGRDKPALVLRTDVANVYGRALPAHIFSHLIADPVEQALQLDAACVVVNLFLIPQQAEIYHQCVANIVALKPLCVRFGMPLMVEPLVMQPSATAGGYMVDGDIEKIVPLVRQAVELGADVIKADPCDDLTAYHRVIETAGGIPVLVRGGGRATDAEILLRTHAVMQEGAAGIVYGRNVVQHRSPRGMTQALMAIVHENATPAQASALLQEQEA
jgi:DhnA family fructose-bisphosphate aldolase class Ia